MKKKTYMFLCDQKRECRGSPGCGLTCRHTTDIFHAKNSDPFKREYLRDSHDFNLWWETERSKL